MQVMVVLTILVKLVTLDRKVLVAVAVELNKAHLVGLVVSVKLNIDL